MLLSSAAQRVLASGGDKTPLGRDFCLGLLPAFSRSPWERWGGAGSAMSCCEAAAQIPWASHCTRRRGGSRRDCFRFIKLGYGFHDAKHLEASVLPLEFILHLSARLIPLAAQSLALF